MKDNYCICDLFPLQDNFVKKRIFWKVLLNFPCTILDGMSCFLRGNTYRELTHDFMCGLYTAVGFIEEIGVSNVTRIHASKNS